MTIMETSASPAESQRHALLVDDDAVISALLDFILKREGYRVDIFKDGLAASEHIARAPAPAVAVLDIMLPRVDGFELLREIRARPDWTRVPVLMLSSRGDEQNIVRALDAGASDYVLKPFQPEELKARLRRLVTRKAAA